MKYDPSAATEINPDFTVGECDFQVETATEKMSKKGEPMIELRLSFLDASHVNESGFDYITAKAPWKIKQFCESVGLPFNLEDKEADFNSFECAGKTGRCIVQADDYNGKKSVKIKEYIKQKDSKAAATKPQSAMDDNALFNDDIPFGQA